ncbi:phospholipase A and acyltransferase 2-like [Lithobates pipiens]
MPLIGPEPKPGDLIEFYRVGYQHWGVYVGNGYIVHLTDPQGLSLLFSVVRATAVVRRDYLESVARGCDYKVNNKYDSKCSPYPAIKIVNAALEEVGKTKNYSVTSANCEHFASYLRYGEQFSDQVDNAKKYAAGGTGILAAIIAFFTIIRRSNRQKQ